MRGRKLRDNILSYLSNYIDIMEPYSVMLAIKKAGVKGLVEELSDKMEESLPTDYDLYSH